MAINLKGIFEQAGLDERSVVFLTNALETNNLPGFDYLEFKQSLAATLAKTGLDEETAYKTVFATAETLGLTKAKLAETAKYYLQVLLKEKGQFDTALQGQIQQRIASREKAIGEAGKNVQQLEAQILQLEEKIRSLRQEIVKVKDNAANEAQEIERERAKIGDTQLAFENTYKAIVEHLSEDLQKIERYL